MTLKTTISAVQCRYNNNNSSNNITIITLITTWLQHAVSANTMMISMPVTRQDNTTNTTCTQLLPMLFCFLIMHTNEYFTSLTLLTVLQSQREPCSSLSKKGSLEKIWSWLTFSKEAPTDFWYLCYKKKC